jgi:hypothetical protein
MNRFKEDLGNNWMFLSIITSTLPLLNKHYPEYILRYSLETTMIIDRPLYIIEQHNNLHHLFSFRYLQLIDLTRSILWTRYNIFLYKIFNLEKNWQIIFSIPYSIRRIILISTMILLSPFFFIYIIFHILAKYHFINNIFVMEIFIIIYC